MSRLLVIAGTDSSGGAGLTRDLATAAGFGVAVCPVVTAVTAQTDQGLHAAQGIEPDLIHAQIISALRTPGIRAVKIGMLGTGDAVRAVAQALKTTELPVVLDPVLRSTSGGKLLDAQGLEVLMDELLPNVTLVTPNLDELATLSGLPKAPVTEQVQRLGAKAVLVKGGHGTGADCTDTLFSETSEAGTFSGPRLPVTKRGTGCTLATAIACGLAEGLSISAACSRAREHLQSWLSAP